MDSGIDLEDYDVDGMYDNFEEEEEDVQEEEPTIENDTEPVVEEEVQREISDERNLGLKFPLTRLKKIMKTDPDLQLASQDAVFLITKATVINIIIIIIFIIINLIYE